MIELNNDVWTKILLFTDIDDILNISSVNKDTLTFCNKHEFWIEYFKFNNVPFIIDDMFVELVPNILSWIEEYKSVDLAYKTSNKLIDQINHEYKIDWLYIEVILPDGVSIQDLNMLPNDILESYKNRDK